MNCPVPCGNVHAPPSAPAGAPTISANALTTAHERQGLGPAQVKNVSPNASNAPPLAHERSSLASGRNASWRPLERKRPIFRSVKGKLTPSAEKRNARNGLRDALRRRPPGNIPVRPSATKHAG